MPTRIQQVSDRSGKGRRQDSTNLHLTNSAAVGRRRRVVCRPPLCAPLDGVRTPRQGPQRLRPRGVGGRHSQKRPEMGGGRCGSRSPTQARKRHPVRFRRRSMGGIGFHLHSLERNKRLIYVSSMTTKTGRLACPTCTVHHRILPLDRYEDRKGKNVIKHDYD